MQIKDSLYLKRIKKGDHEAYETLYNEYRDEFYSMMINRVKNEMLAAELLQNLWVKIWECPDFVKTDENGQMGAFIYSYLHYRIMDYYRNAKKVAEIYTDTAGKLYEIPDEKYFEIWEQYTVEEALNFIEECVADLPDSLKKIYALRFKKRLSVSEIATKMNLSERTINNYISILIKHLKDEAESKKISNQLFTVITYFLLFSD